ncbi:hypothetical protein P7C73_g122, partial [Tremellales sp. Uapishka_1]
MGVALDCNYITTYGSADTARTQVLNDWNQISALYKQTFNISLGITELVVQNETCGGGPSWNVDCNTNMTLDERLSEFSEWRGDRSNDGIGLWHLMSLASSGTVCRAAVDAVCDYAEVCSGSNATCPVDRTAPDGESCGTGGLACASGRCTSLTLQCQTAGASENLTTACGQKDDTSCVVSCKDPSTANQCLVLQTPLIDGSPCGYGGHCYNQTCKAGSTDAIIGAWYTSNLQIAIPVTVIAGLIVIIILWLIVRCSVRCCTRRKGPVQSPTHPTPVSMSQQPIASAPPILHRHANSVSSQDPIIRTGLISREPSPYGTLSYRNSAALDDGLAGYQQNVSGRGGIGEYGYQQNGHLAPHAPWPQPHASGRTSGWVDHTTYNGPEYTGR